MNSLDEDDSNTIAIWSDIYSDSLLDQGSRFSLHYHSPNSIDMIPECLIFYTVIGDEVDTIGKIEGIVGDMETDDILI